MKSIYIYSQHSELERNMIERALIELPSNVDVVEFDDIPLFMRKYIRATPCLVIFNDDLQGDQLLGEGIDGSLIVTAVLNKRMEEEDSVIHNIEVNRMDNLINIEIVKAIDDYTIALIDGGVI